MHSGHIISYYVHYFYTLKPGLKHIHTLTSDLFTNKQGLSALLKATWTVAGADFFQVAQTVGALKFILLDEPEPTLLLWQVKVTGGIGGDG